MDGNTTQVLIEDLEALRESLGIEGWLLHGVSWGSTLALAYALTLPGRVSGVVLAAVTTGSRAEIDWLTEGVGSVFPEAWTDFTREVPEGRRPVEYYAELLRNPDAAVRARAADRWDAWESTHISLDPAWTPGPHHADPRERANFATLVTHYWANDCFLRGQDAVLPRAGQLTGIPGVLIHGRRDISGPVGTAWRLHQHWPASVLHVVESEGHGGDIHMQLVAEATTSFLTSLK